MSKQRSHRGAPKTRPLPGQTIIPKPDAPRPVKFGDLVQAIQDREQPKVLVRIKRTKPRQGRGR